MAIEELPKIPSSIEDAIMNKNLAIFIGAGVSRIIGCDGWGKLANTLIDVCFNTTKPDGKTLINFKEKETLSNNNDYKKVISICHGILKQYDEDIFFDALEKSLENDDKLIESFNIYKELYHLLHDGFSGIDGLFLTTNADEHFDTAFGHDEIVFDPEKFSTSDIKNIKLYHLHGTISDRNSLVFTVDQYINRYNNPSFYERLNEIFSKYRILFIGYGLDEFEILDYLITILDILKKTPEETKELKNFILLPYYNGEDNIMEFDQIYYKNLGINVVGYQKDQNGYNQLYYVIKEWREQISNIRSPGLYDPDDEIDKVVDAHE